MKINSDVILKNPLFRQIKKDELEAMLSCMSARVVKFKKDNFIFAEGETVDKVGVLMTGKLAIVREDEEGRRSIISEVSPPESFGEVFACSDAQKSMVSVIATQDSEVLFIDYKKIITACSSACAFHARLIQNMLGFLSDRVLFLHQKLDIVSKRRTRDKLMAFLVQQRAKANSNEFLIPYNREELADFLFVDRSAMSAELCKMRDEGVIKFNKNRFEII